MEKQKTAVLTELKNKYVEELVSGLVVSLLSARKKPWSKTTSI